MVFREPRFKSAAGSISYGPFPIRMGRLAGSFAPLLIATLLTAMSFDEDRLVCTPGGSCVITHVLGADEPPFPTSALRDVAVKAEQGSKNRKYGAIVLVLGNAREVRLGRTDPDAAEQMAAATRAAIAARRPIDIAIRGPWWMLVGGVALLAMWISMAYSALKGLGRIRLDLVQGGASLRVQRRVLGVPLASYEVSLEGVTDVRVAPGVLGEMWLRRGEAMAEAGWVVLVDRAGQARPITDRAFPGRATHLRAASTLRAILGLERQRGGVEEQLEALPMITTPLAQRIMFSWIGVTVGFFVGLGVYGVVGLSLGLLRAREGLDGSVFVIGGGGGVVAGVALVAFLTRARTPR